MRHFLLTLFSLTLISMTQMAFGETYIVTRTELPSKYGITAQQYASGPALKQLQAGKPITYDTVMQDAAYTHAADLNPLKNAGGVRTGIYNDSLSTDFLLAGQNATRPSTGFWLPYFTNYVAAASRTLQGNKGGIDRVSIFAFQFTPEGKLVPATPWVSKVLADLAAKPANRPKEVMITIKNDVEGRPAHDTAIVSQILATKESRAAVIKQLVEISKMGDGLDIDFEKVDPADKDKYTAFVHELSDALPSGKKLSIVLEPIKSLKIADWGDMAKHAELDLMAYYYSWETSPPGPIASINDITKLVQSAQDHNVPLDKLNISLSLVGFDWTEGGKGQRITYVDAQGLAGLPGAQVTRSDDGMKIAYTDAAGKGHTAYIDDVNSLKAKAALLKKLGVNRSNYWHGGIVDPAILSWLQSTK